MKKFKTLSFAFGAALLFIAAGPSCPAFASGSTFSANFRIACSTTPTSPTLVSAASTGYKKTTLLNSNTNYVLIGDGSTTFSTSASTGSARLINASYSPDAGGDWGAYTGAIYCVGSDTVNNVIDVWRIK